MDKTMFLYQVSKEIIVMLPLYIPPKLQKAKQRQISRHMTEDTNK